MAEVFVQRFKELGLSTIFFSEYGVDYFSMPPEMRRNVLPYASSGLLRNVHGSIMLPTHPYRMAELLYDALQRYKAKIGPVDETLDKQMKKIEEFTKKLQTAYSKRIELGWYRDTPFFGSIKGIFNELDEALTNYDFGKVDLKYREANIALAKLQRR